MVFFLSCRLGNLIEMLYHTGGIAYCMARKAGRVSMRCFTILLG
jgi:hypothetical protein